MHGQKTLKIGTRGSTLALTQARMVEAALLRAHPGFHIEIVKIKTGGDWSPAQGEVPLEYLAGGKAQFADKIESALADGLIDMAVHSMKDMDSTLPEGLVIDHMLPREDPRDCLLFNDIALSKQAINTWPSGTIVGTVSARRAAFLLARNPALKIVPFRGNVETRIAKLRAGQVDVTILAMAGLKRLDLVHEADLILECQDMPPSAGQGAVGIEIRQHDSKARTLLEDITCRDTTLVNKTERSVLSALGGSCRTPVGVHAVLKDNGIGLSATTIAPDGTKMQNEEAYCPTRDMAQAQAFGRALGLRLKARTPQSWLRF